jgi:putative hydrolase of the HAD superfamily
LRRREPGWQAYWRAVVRAATGVEDDRVFQDLYAHFERAEAWRVAAGAATALVALRELGLGLGLISNWDVRLVGLLTRLDLTHLFDVVIVSAVERVEKPDPAIFLLACRRMGFAPNQVLHVGDDPRDDVDGARAAGLHAWHFGTDIQGFPDLASRARLVR